MTLEVEIYWPGVKGWYVCPAGDDSFIRPDEPGRLLNGQVVYEGWVYEMRFTPPQLVRTSLRGRKEREPVWQVAKRCLELDTSGPRTRFRTFLVEVCNTRFHASPLPLLQLLGTSTMEEIRLSCVLEMKG